MAQDTSRTLADIGVGASTNDGTGDPLRTAFQSTNANFDEVAPNDPNVNVFSANSTLGLADTGRLLVGDSTNALTLSIPSSSVVSFNTGAYAQIVANGTGTLTVSPNSGVTLHSPGGSTGDVDLASQYAMATLIKKSSDIWNIQGNLA